MILPFFYLLLTNAKSRAINNRIKSLITQSTYNRKETSVTKVEGNTHVPVAKAIKLFGNVDDATDMGRKLDAIIECQSGFRNVFSKQPGRPKITGVPVKQCGCGGTMYGCAAKEDQTLLMCDQPGCYGIVAKPSHEFPFLSKGKSKKN